MFQSDTRKEKSQDGDLELKNTSANTSLNKTVCESGNNKTHDVQRWDVMMWNTPHPSVSDSHWLTCLTHFIPSAVTFSLTRLPSSTLIQLTSCDGGATPDTLQQHVVCWTGLGGSCCTDLVLARWPECTTRSMRPCRDAFICLSRRGSVC